MALLAAQEKHNDYVRQRYQEIQSLKMPATKEALARVKETEPDAWRWIQALELFNTKIWCDKCNATCVDHEVSEEEFENAKLPKLEPVAVTEPVGTVQAVQEAEETPNATEQNKKSKFAW